MKEAIVVAPFMGQEIDRPQIKIPPWIKRQLPFQKEFFITKSVLAQHRLNTICEDAKCPNVWECWSRKTATFMILGGVCTRSCGFCSVAKGRPGVVDRQEPGRIASAVRQLGLRFVVITSVDRDDLEDQGAGQFRDTITAIRWECLDTKIEILTPDFRGQEECLKILFDSGVPDVFAHNVETVPRLYRTVRRGSSYERSLGVLKSAKSLGKGIKTKSGLMIGLGETQDEVLQTLEDMRRHEVDIVTIGQYLKPSQKNLDVVKYYPFSTFNTLASHALQMGFSGVRSGPLVRSSYHADEMAGNHGSRSSET